MPLTPYSLDNFVGHKLSSLTKCGAPELSPRGPWLSILILNTIAHTRLPAKQRAYITNFLRKAENAIFAYQEAQSALLEYVSKRHSTVVSPYFRSLSNFETCIAHTSRPVR